MELLYSVLGMLAAFVGFMFFQWKQTTRIMKQERLEHAKERIEQIDKAVDQANPDELADMGNDLLRKLSGNPKDQKE